MNPKRILGSILVSSLGFISLSPFPNDQSVAVAAGGIVPKRESRVSMKKERLFISPGKVRVEYSFENESDADVTTQIAFPVPEYAYPWESPTKDFSDFKLWVDGSPVPFQTEAHAFTKGKDQTEILQKLGITVENFGGFDHYDTSRRNGVDYFRHYQVSELTLQQQEQLIGLGLIEGGNSFNRLVPRWSVRKAYYWTQRFPAKQVVVIRHEYSPVIGSKQVKAEDVRREIDGSCVSGDLAERIRLDESRDNHELIYAGWVDYILTTANTWKTPIKEFELIVEISPIARSIPTPKYMSFCWNGRSEISYGNALSVRAIDFVPSKELKVYFFW